MSRTHIEQLLRELEATPESERGQFITRKYLESLSSELRTAVIRMAKHDYFDLEILKADCPEYQDSIESIYSQLQSLCLVEEFPHYGFNVHELTRKHLANTPF